MRGLWDPLAMNTRGLVMVALALGAERRARPRAELVARADALLDARWELMAPCSCSACAQHARRVWLDARVQGTSS